MKLSVIIPIYNEINTIDIVLRKVTTALPHIPKEIILVDDGSQDGTREWLIENFGNPREKPVKMTLSPDHPFLSPETNNLVSISSQTKTATNQTAAVSFKVIFHAVNQGKGASLCTGFQEASGDIFVIQDADLEYDPQDWQKMWQLIIDAKADVVYGSRFYGNPHRVLYFYHLLGNKIITTLVNLASNTTFTDIEVCYKMFRREVLDDISLTCKDFGFEVEFTIKVACSPCRWRLYETGISYYGRSYEEGKKINWTDGVKALWYILKFRLIR
ncbi:MAG: glycosyltransferase family 2 protein [Spirulinaceae cyanobacterium]